MFKHTCGESDTLTPEPDKPVKRPRMSSLDPAHYIVLFDLIRLTRPRIIEVCKEKKGKEKKVVSQTYSMIVHKLVCGEPWPEATVTTCQSQNLTEVLLDLNIDCSVSALDSFTSSIASMSFTDCNKSTIVCDTLIDAIITDTENDRKTLDKTSDSCDHDLSSWSNTQDVQDLTFSTDFSCDLLVDESDYNCLNSDLAQNLLAGLFELTELPEIDQSTLDQVFLAPPQKEARCIQQRRGGGGQGGGSTGAAASFSTCPSSHSLSPTEPSVFPKMNIHHPPTIPSLPYHHHHHHHHQMLPPSSSAFLSNRQYFPGDMRDVTPASLTPPSACSFGKDSLMDMHSYSISMDGSSESSGIGNLTNLCMSRVGPPNMPSKCIKAYSKTLLGPTGKLNIQALPRTAQKGSSCFPTIQSGGRQSPYCSRQQEQHLMPSHMLQGSSTAGLKSGKGRSHHFVPAKFNPQTYSVKASSTISPASSCSRFYPQHAGLGSSSPLITSLAPLRNVKYQGQVSTKLYSSSPCAVMPYRPRLQLAESSNMEASSFCNRRSTYNVPITTTLNSFATARAQEGNIQHIKVCLPTQALKIPIAKLRGTKKSTYIKGKLKNVGLPPPGPESVGNISCMAQQGSKTSGVLAKVLSFQVKSETVCAGADFRSPIITEVSYASPKLSSTTSTFIGTMRPMTSQLDCCRTDKNGFRNSKKVQLVSVDSRSGYSRSMGSTHTAVIVSPVSAHKRSSGRQYLYSSASSAMGTFRTTASLNSNSSVVSTSTFNSTSDNLTSLHLNPTLHNPRYLPKTIVNDAKSKCSRYPPVCVRNERSLAMKPNPLSTQEDEDEIDGSQFVVVGTRTTCLPIPRQRNKVFSSMETQAHQEREKAIESSLSQCLSTAANAHQLYNQDTQEALQSSDSCNTDDKQSKTSSSISPDSTRFNDPCSSKSVSTSGKTMGHETLYSEETSPFLSQMSVKIMQETLLEDVIPRNCQNEIESSCQTDDNLKALGLENMDNAGETFQGAHKVDNVGQTTLDPFKGLSDGESEAKSTSQRKGDSEAKDSCIDKSSQDRQVCED
ncbi:hypothetical protein ElyMa_002714900 [Elysia marginata]|uniref:Tantalus-like domain-containing protein n=1 Tax=Elysia marginata TaxID=1093978 RepID=A0AAV4HFK8_9GAST|nr:hypothetical protein ElyMa_002714900 [Elysia marginata]